MIDKQAFPGSHYGPTRDGMSLRDYFAGQALSGILASGKIPTMTGIIPGIVEYSYKLAEQMLEESKKWSSD